MLFGGFVIARDTSTVSVQAGIGELEGRLHPLDLGWSLETGFCSLLPKVR